ncbi:imelysin family protein [Halomonas llamarensis]|uniref:Imelysin family protein n=1 Tax=Halomonas llamarensis TaxID=2945104 RepID=A0ABT0SQJ0_9GAMM|nr:imelysin family protein [Halomonas llamarensis]MCL7930083.1 imelysin family protein [Halomonas llamarensis]
MQQLTRLVGVSALALSSALAMTASASDTSLEARKRWHQAIYQGYQSLETEAEDFSQAASTYCSDPTPDARQAVEQDWLAAFLAWQQVRFVDFGPVEHNNLSWQFQFWPDPKNIVARKAGYLLKSDDQIDKDLIKASGVAVQGFPMTEYLLFDEPLNSGANALPTAKTCRLLTAVAHHIETNSEQLSHQWRSLRDHYLANDQYRDSTIRAGMAALEILEERRLAQPMGLRGTGKRSAYAADAWRSGTSLRTIEATIRGLKQHFLPGLSVLLTEAEQSQLARQIAAQFDEVLDNFPTLHRPIDALLSDDKAFAELQGLYMDVSQLATLVNDQAASTLGVVRGFNSSDGD